MKRTLIFISVAVALFALGACNNTETATTEKTSMPGANATGTPAAFKNDKGQLLCPVMGSVISSEASAVSYQDHNGKRYYFCCDGCPENFKKDPAKYENGKAIPKSGTM